jgi:transposase
MTGVSAAEIAQAAGGVAGPVPRHHALLVGLSLDHLAHLEAAVTTLDGEVDGGDRPYTEARDHLDTITGVGKRVAECVIADIGVDMSRFATARHLASWAGVAPGNNITGGKRRSGTRTKGEVWLGEALNQCAWAAARSRDTYLSAQFWRLSRRIGKKKAAVAVGTSGLDSATR